MKLDSFLKDVIKELITKHRCHTVILYGSRARGKETSTSDYDVMGVRAKGPRRRIAELRNTKYLDLFIYPEKDLKKIEEHLFYMKDGKVLHEEKDFGTKFLKRLIAAYKKPVKSLPPDEIKTRKAWAHKMVERAKVGDIEGNFRRTWLQMALLEDYFALRKLRYEGSKASFEWLKKNDKVAYKAFERCLATPTELKLLERLVQIVIHPKS